MDDPAEMDEIAVINIRNGSVKPHGDHVLTDEEQEELLLQGLETYELPTDDYEYEIYELEEYL